MTELSKMLIAASVAITVGASLQGCDSSSSTDSNDTHMSGDDHAGEDHDDHSGENHEDHGSDDMDSDHDHGDEVSLGTAMIGDIEIEAAQGHGEVAPGKELHLVVKLPYTDSGASEVRVWIGTDDRFASVVEKASYASSHDDYDAHAVAPDPLPENAAWWIEITRPDGTVQVGSIALH